MPTNDAGLKLPDLICVCESVYRGALTRGARYEVLALDPDRRQARMRGDNGRVRWFPLYCFAAGDVSVPRLAAFRIDDPIDPDGAYSVEVTVTLTDGQLRWCVFATPEALAASGELIDAGPARFHFGNRHIIIATALSEALIGAMLRQIDGQGELLACTLALEPDKGD
ncbi:MAG: hypothetical protein R3E83_00530 [Burkholderiaceae bacterium]